MKKTNRITRLVALALAGLLILSLLPLAAFAEETQTAEETYDIPEDAIYLSTAEDILALAENCISDAWSRDKVFVLSNDIDLKGAGFEGIPTFGGTFLGQGYTISGLYLTKQQDVTGFFRYLQKTAVVDDLHLKGTVQPTRSYDVGGLAGINNGMIRNCSFTGIVSGTERVGGIAGRNKLSGIIENCTVSGLVHGDHYVGGFVGANTGVIRFCRNEAEVNTHVDHNTVGIGGLGNISLDSLKESIEDATNLGGIAGTSSGVIRSCENHANVGYEKLGYNVGGIAGSQIGYITDCINYGAVQGSNGVGGIVGQFKPNVALNFGENPMENMTDQMSDLLGAMMGMMGSMNNMMGTMEDMTGGTSSDTKDLEDMLGQLQDPETWENMDEDSLNAALNGMSKEFQDMYDDMLSTGEEMGEQMDNMEQSMDDMMVSMEGLQGTMQQLGSGMNIKVYDISKMDTPDNMLTKVNNCANYGTVFAENYAGGIAGIADVEDTTLQEQVSGELSFSNEGEAYMRLVIRDCSNHGGIAATKQYAGGIVGNMAIGAVFGSLNVGGIDGTDADYVGGIAGCCENYITDSFSRCILAGSRYVGGIAGFGKEILNCYAISDLTGTQNAGGIAGMVASLPDEDTTLVAGNSYCLTGKNVGGIDGICYQGATSAITIAQFMALEDLNAALTTVTVRFVAEGQEDVVLTLSLGESLSLEDVPQLEVGDTEQYHWRLRDAVSTGAGFGQTVEVRYLSQERLTNILFDQTYVAEFDAKNLTIETAEKTESGRPLALAVGAFNNGTTLTLTDITDQVQVVDGMIARESWQITVSNIGIQKLHYHIPEGVESEDLILYVKDTSGNYVRRDFTVEGSYMIFPMAHGEEGFVLCDAPIWDGITIHINADAMKTIMLVMVVTAAVVVAGGVILLRKRKAKKKGMTHEET